MIALFVLFLGLVWLRLREFTASPVLLISQTAIVKLGNQADSLVRNKALAFFRTVKFLNDSYISYVRLQFIDSFLLFLAPL